MIFIDEVSSCTVQTFTVDEIITVKLDVKSNL